MQSTRIIQICIIALVGGLIAFIFVSGKNNSTALSRSQVHANANEGLQALNDSFNFQLLEKDVKEKLKKKDAEEIMKLEGELKGRGKMEANWRKLAEKYEELQQPALAGYYYGQLAEKNPDNEQYWFHTGKNFFEAQQLVDDSLSYVYFVDRSFKAFEKVLALNPGNFEAKADQAVNYIEGKGQPMMGVGLLKEILQVEPDNRKALYYLGLMSIQSGQMEKAVERFEKLVSLGQKDDPNYPYYYRSLGQAYASLGQKDKALAAFENYKGYTAKMANPAMKEDAENLINSLK